MASYVFKERELTDFLVGKTHTAITRRLLRNFRQTGLTLTTEQWTVLNVLWEEDGLTQLQIASKTFKDKPSITRLMDNLERLHLVVRIPDKFDKRINLIFLTQKGRALKNRAAEQAQKTLEEAFLNITDSQLRIYFEVQALIFKNLNH